MIKISKEVVYIDDGFTIIEHKIINETDELIKFENSKTSCEEGLLTNSLNRVSSVANANSKKSGLRVYSTNKSVVEMKQLIVDYYNKILTDRKKNYFAAEKFYNGMLEKM